MSAQSASMNQKSLVFAQTAKCRWWLVARYAAIRWWVNIFTWEGRTNGEFWIWEASMGER